MRAVHLVYQGWSTRKAARHLGFSQAAIVRWVKKDKELGLLGWRPIPTESSRPKNHPKQLKEDIVNQIVAKRLAHHRCAEVVHRELANDGIKISLSSVKRTLDRKGLIRKRSLWKRWHFSESRPEAINAGDLVQIDTIHVVPKQGQRFYVYTLIDVVSRWAYAMMSLRANTHQSLRFVKKAQKSAPFSFKMLQSDHGSEFSTWFTEHVKKQGVAHRHSRVRKPNDNGHLERFNRTLQEECLNKMPPLPAAYQSAIRSYLPYYNNQRLHLGINLKTPLQVITSY